MSYELLYVIWLGVSGLILFLLMGSDKRKAAEGGRRISEKALFTWALIGGGVGGWLGMRVFHHKTKHWYFALGFPLIAVLQVLMGAYLLIK